MPCKWKTAFIAMGMAIVIIACLSLYPIKALRSARWVSRSVAFHLNSSTPDMVPPQKRLAAVNKELPGFPLPQARVVIHKGERRANLFSGDRLVKTYRIGLGGNPEGHKKVKGDGKTPEGSYFICTRLDQTRYHLFLGLNYPSAADAQDALKAKRIDQATCDGIVKAQSQRQSPSWSTPLSGAIGLHGGGSHSDWTLGCIAFDDADIEEIWAATCYWTPVEIHP